MTGHPTSPAHRLAIELGAPRGDRDGTKLVPMLCGRDETGERVLGEQGWMFELKLDGVRILADKRGDRVALGYRKVRSATDSYPEIAEAVAKLGEERVVLDGEVVAFDEHGKPDFQRLGTRIQTRGRGVRRAAHAVPVVYVIFDVLVVGDRDVTSLPIEARKTILEKVLEGHTSGHLRLHPTFADGRQLFGLCRDHQLEGVVAKRASSTYRPDGRSEDWVKVKCELDADLVVIGWTEGEGRRSRLGALDLAAYEDGRLVVRGSVGSGLDEDTIDVLVDRLVANEVPRPVAEGRYLPKRGRRHTKPEIVVSVRHMGLTADGLMRHPVFRGVRPDLSPSDCTIAFAARGPSKDALYTYYEAAFAALLPHVRGRACPVLRADGAPSSSLPGGIVVDDLEALRFVVEAGGASLSLPPARTSNTGAADFVALRIEGASAIRVARHARELVTAAGLEAFVKASGASDLDVLVPLGDAPAGGAKVLAALFARMLAAFAEGLGASVTAVEAPIAPYAVAVPVPARGPACASLPLAWDELDGLHDAGAAITRLDRVAERIARGASDPMRAMHEARVDFARAVQAIDSFVRDPAAR
ncbi:MAG: ATP-dependent ligase [Labilithrix sp.]|nr:ATP-dependent ligase [Labilithrix sp.]